MICELAVKEHVRCPGCGSVRDLGALGLDADGNYDPAAAPTYAPEVMIRQVHGYKNIQWSRTPLSERAARGLRDRLRAVLAQLDGLLS